MYGITFKNLCYLGYNQPLTDTFNDLVRTTFPGCTGAFYDYEGQFQLTPTSTEADFAAYIEHLRTHPVDTLEGRVYYDAEGKAAAAVESLNGTVVNGKAIWVALENK